MEQRALLAVALVAGCVTAAGAGGYLAVRQLASHPAPTPAAESTPVPDAAAAVDGTEAELAPSEPVAESPAPVTPAPAVSRPAPAAASAPAPRPAPPAPARPTRAETPAPARSIDPPVATARRADPPAATPVPVSRPVEVAPPPAPVSVPATTQAQQAPAPAPAPAPAQPRVEERQAANETWSSSRDSGTPRADTWPTRDREPEPDLSAPLPSRTPAPEPTTAPSGVPRLVTLTIPADSVIGVQLENTVTTATAKVEDPVRARVTRDLRVGSDVLVPAGSRLMGNVTLVEEGGKIRERARLGVRFHTLVLADGTEVKLPTETIYRDGESPTGRSAAKIGGATVGGAILGAILGGGRGAVIGAASGAGSGTAMAMAGERRPAELRSGQPLTIRVSDAVTTQVER